MEHNQVLSIPERYDYLMMKDIVLSTFLITNVCITLLYQIIEKPFEEHCILVKWFYTLSCSAKILTVGLFIQNLLRSSRLKTITPNWVGTFRSIQIKAAWNASVCHLESNPHYALFAWFEHYTCVAFQVIGDRTGMEGRDAVFWILIRQMEVFWNLRFVLALYQERRCILVFLPV